MTLLLLAVLGLTPTADAAAPGQQTTALSSQQVATLLFQQQAKQGELEGQLAEARRLVAAAKKLAASSPDPAVQTVDLAPLTARVTALEGQLGTLNSQIAALNAAVAGKASQADFERLAGWVAGKADQSDLEALGRRVTALENAPPPVVAHDTVTVVRTSGNRAQFGVGEALTMAPPLPGSTISVMDRTEIVGRLQHAVGGVWFGAEVDAGYGFALDSTNLRALGQFTANLGDATDLVLGAGPSVGCEETFTGPALCSVTRTGGQVQVGISQQLGPFVLDFVGGGGYDAVDSVEAGPGNVGYGFLGTRVLLGKAGSGVTISE